MDNEYYIIGEKYGQSNHSHTSVHTEYNVYLIICDVSVNYEMNEELWTIRPNLKWTKRGYVPFFFFFLSVSYKIAFVEI